MTIGTEEIFFGMLFATFAGLSTALGAAGAFFIKKPSERILAFSLGFSAGIMVAISFLELYPSAIDELDLLNASIAFIAGVIFLQTLDYLIPHYYAAEWNPSKAPSLAMTRQVEGLVTNAEHSGASEEKVLRVGMLTAFGIAVHNFPEGFITITGTMGGGIKLGLVIAIAITLHNIPEGFSVAAPIYYATGDRKKAFRLSFLSGLAEPVGALLGVLILLPFLETDLIAFSMAFVAGIMVFISLDELLPTASSYPGQEKVTALGVTLGMILMIGTLIAFA